MLKYLYKRNSAELIIHEVYMTRKRSKLKAKTHRTKSTHKTRTSRPRVRKTQKGGTNPKTQQVLQLVASSKLLRQESLPKLTIAGIEIIDKNIDDSFSQGSAFPVEGLIRTYSGISPKKINGACSSITKDDLDILSDSLTKVEERFNIQKSRLFQAEFSSQGKREPLERPDPRLYRLFYQIMTEDDLKAMIKHLMGGYNPHHKSQLTEEFRTKRFGELVHSYMYKIFAGIATKQAMTDVVLKYRTPGGPPPVPPGGGLGGPPPGPPPPPPPIFPELRNLCLVMRDILGLINYLFRQELTNELGVIGNTQYCHSGGNMFYVMAMMVCYIHTRHYPGNVYRADPGYDPYDILDQIMFTFDIALGAEKECFYRYLHELMKNRIFAELLAKITASMSDLDFLCLTSLDALLTEPNREKMKDITYLMGGILLEHCGIGLATGMPNIALNVILPSNQPKDPRCGPFSESRRSPVEARIKGQVDAILSPYLPRLDGIKLSTNKINILKIFLVRIKVAMEQDNISDELRKIFGEKLDFVIGSLQSPFYCYKQCKFFHCDYYSLETFIHELKEILTTSHDDKSDKREDRYQLFNILSYIDNHKNPAYCLIDHINIIVDQAIGNSQNEKEKTQKAQKAQKGRKEEITEEERNGEEPEAKRAARGIEKTDMCEGECNAVNGREPGSRGDGGGGGGGAGGGDKGVCWFNLLFGIIFQFLDPTTKNKSAEGCVNTCDDIPPGPPPPGPPSGPPNRPPPRDVLLRRALSQNGQLQAISENLRRIQIDFDPAIFDDQLGFSIEEMNRLQQEMVPITEWSQNIFTYLIDFLPNRSELLLGSLLNAEALRLAEHPNPETIVMRDTRLGEDRDIFVIAAQADVIAAQDAEEAAQKAAQKAEKAYMKAAEKASEKAVMNEDTPKSKVTSHKSKAAYEKANIAARTAEATYSSAQATAAEAKEEVVQANAEMKRAWMDAKKQGMDAAKSARQQAMDARESAKQYALSARASALVAKAPMNEQREDK